MSDFIDPGDYQDDIGNLVPELEDALQKIGSKGATPQNRGLVEESIPFEVRKVLIRLGYIEQVRFDPTQENYPNWYQDGFDHYRLTLKGRSYFPIRSRRRWKTFTERILPSIIAFFAAIAGAYIGTGALTG